MSELTGQFPISDSDTLDLVDLQLQQELRAMFEVDSQQYLQDYLNLVQRLQAPTWSSDIQELYRAIHTIKGGSVTVGADAILYVSAALEDVLSDLRHLNPAPPLGDRQLEQMLLEAGELLAGSLQIKAIGNEAQVLVQPSVQRIQALREQIKQAYLPEWNEQTLLHQEFADQGFDLVVLDLEMAIEQLPFQGEIAAGTLEIAQQTLLQLAEIGQDLEFKPAWSDLLALGESLIEQPSTEIWRSRWPGFLVALKASARQGGVFVEPTEIVVAEPAIALVEQEHLTEPLISSDLTLDMGLDEEESLSFDFGGMGEALEALESMNLDLPMLSVEPEIATDLSSLNLNSLSDALELYDPTELYPSDLNVSDLDQSSFAPDDATPAWDDLDQSSLERSPAIAINPSNLVDDQSTTDTTALSADLEFNDLDVGNLIEAVEAFTTLGFDPEIVSSDDLLSPEDPDAWLGLVAPDPTLTRLVLETRDAPVAPDTPPQSILAQRSETSPGEIQIPVPLNRLDQTAQNLVETLLTARASQGLYQTLQSQLTQLFSLAKESTQYITRLRQIQDDYALLDNLKVNSPTAGPTLERYRQGYTTINRLLETSLRLSELGAEAEKTAGLTADSIQSLDRNILRLRQTVEQSRLVPFKSLGFRARAILRDLTTRFGKPARLVVEGEQIEIDAGTASKLEPVLLHLIRNAYDHGLDTSEMRVAAGKSEQGTIHLSLKRRGGSYQLDITDDGRGIDAAAIQKSATAKGLPLTATDTPAQLLAVLCQSGFSSKDTVSDISGRGVGMDVVATQITNLGGRLRLDTTLGVGTSFQLQFPAPQLLVSCVLVQAGDRAFAVPAQDIATTTIFGSLDAKPVPSPNSMYSWQVQQGEDTVPGLDLLEYWRPQMSTRPLTDTAICLYVRPTDSIQGVWILADELIGQTELLITPLPSPLAAPLGFLGVSLQSDGSLVPIVEVSAIAELLLQPVEQQPTAIHPSVRSETNDRSGYAPPVPESDAVVHLTRTILVVDDAALMRRRLEASLTAYGYSVVTCADGQEAWNWLQTHPVPAMVLTDLEMPNMDGFTLIDRARQAGITIPMVVVSSRLAEEWNKEAKRLGATDYLTKGFTTQQLIDKVKQLLSQTVAV
jgi:chemotaxis protein histidine kinase CheA/ActR/RegA family two-component response regulator